MRTFEEIHPLRAELSRLKKQGKTIGFVPTMGYLHEGHLSLVRASRKRCDVTVVSIFVNPTQFAPNEDLAKYPRDMARDKTLLEKEKADILFAPGVAEMYPEDEPRTFVEVPELGQKLCGRSRPTHFRGVTTVVAKLFNIVQPDQAFFGLKDYQQYVIIKKMARDLDLPVEVVGCPIVREKDGLAMSSRNVYLSPAERKAALVLSKALTTAKELVQNSRTELSADELIRKLRNIIQQEPLAKIDYLEIVDSKTFQPVNNLNEDILVATAVFIGKTRLIDNIILSR
jgi:pantoate--beta-alanine ligase